MGAGTPQRVDIQGFRALAVLLVLADHLGIGLVAGGYVGVDVFFVLSGFLISSLLYAEVQRTGRVGIGAFYARRARRILPAGTLVLAATLAFLAVTAPMTRVREAAGDTVWAALFLANVNLGGQGRDYFDDTGGISAVQHYWSLAVEEQFYLVWPALLAVLAYWWLRRGAHGPRFRRRSLVLLVTGLCVASLGYSVWLTGHDPQAAYFSTPARAWELGAGALLALLGPWCLRLTRALRVALSALGLLAIGLAATTYDAATPFPGWHAALPIVGTVALLAAGTGAEHPWPGRILTVRPAPWIGDISYSLYLWHWPVIILGKQQFPQLASRTGSLVLVAVSLLLAWLSYRFVETPFRTGRVRGLSRGRGALALWPVAVGCVLLTAAAAPAWTQHRLDVVEQDRQAYFADEDHRVDVDALDGVGDVRRAVRAQVELARQDAPLPGAIVNRDRLEDDLWQFTYTCNAGRTATSVEVCPVGAQDSERTVVVYGDSHAGVWLPALDRSAEHRGLRLVPLIKVGCAPFDVDRLRNGEPATDCREFHAWAERTIAELQPDLVVLSYRGMRPEIDVDVPGEPAGETWRRGVDSALGRLAQLAPTLVLSDYSFADFRPRDCLTDPEARMRDCTFSARQDTRTGNRITRDVARRHDVPFVDVAQLVCARGSCPTVVGDIATYRDESHLSVTWVRRVTGAVEELVDPWLPTVA